MKTTLLLISKYEDYLINLVPTMNKSKEKICYTTFNKSFNYLIEYLPSIGLNKEIYFIDCTSSQKKPELSTCKFVPKPVNLKNITQPIAKAAKNKYSFVIIDSLSKLIENNKSLDNNKKELKEFIQSLSKKTKNLNILFISNEKDKKTEFIQGAISSFNSIETKL